MTQTEFQPHATWETCHYNRQGNKYEISYLVINVTLKLQPLESSEKTQLNSSALHSMVWILNGPKCHMLKACPKPMKLWGDGGTFSSQGLE